MDTAERYERLAQDIRGEDFDLAERITSASSANPFPSAPPLKPTPKIVQPKLNLADFIDPAAQPPAALDRSALLANALLRDPLGNDQWGDCGDAMTLHAIEAFHLINGTPVPPFVTGDSLGLYSAVSGFNPNAGSPGHNPTDTGTDNQQLVDYWRDHGVTCAADGSKHSIAGSLFVDPHDNRVARIAMFEFVVLFRALALPVTAQGQSPWRLTDKSLHGPATPGSWGYHDVPYLSYDKNWVHCDTWGEDGLVGWGFDRAYGVQGFVVVTQEMLNLQGVSPSGLDWTALNTALSRFPPARP